MTAFVLVPGAWLGAWAWEDTTRALRAHGHTALPLTLTGLGEYAGRGTPETDLETHIADITGFVLGPNHRHLRKGRIGDPHLAAIEDHVVAGILK